VMGRPALGTDERYGNQAARNRNEAELEALIGEWTASRTLDELQAALDAEDVPATRIYTMADIFADRHFQARGMLVPTPDDDLGEVTLAGVVPRMSLTPGHVRWSGRRIGQDTRAVLRRMTGLSDADIDALEAEGVVSCDPQARDRPAASDAPR
jgi:crotonobetainyl-CoA:carnitine CoA-transferase CaiB-like acyl-CoA transferase